MADTELPTVEEEPPTKDTFENDKDLKWHKRKVKQTSWQMEEREELYRFKAFPPST